MASGSGCRCSPGRGWASGCRCSGCLGSGVVVAGVGWFGRGEVALGGGSYSSGVAAHSALGLPDGRSAPVQRGPVPREGHSRRVPDYHCSHDPQPSAPEAADVPVSAAQPAPEPAKSQPKPAQRPSAEPAREPGSAAAAYSHRAAPAGDFVTWRPAAKSSLVHRRQAPRQRLRIRNVCRVRDINIRGAIRVVRPNLRRVPAVNVRHVHAVYIHRAGPVPGHKRLARTQAGNHACHAQVAPGPPPRTNATSAGRMRADAPGAGKIPGGGPGIQPQRPPNWPQRPHSGTSAQTPTARPPPTSNPTAGYKPSGRYGAESIPQQRRPSDTRRHQRLASADQVPFPSISSAPIMSELTYWSADAIVRWYIVSRASSN